MKKRKRFKNTSKQDAITPEIKQKIEDNMYKYGMNPYNAAVVAGLSNKAAEALHAQGAFNIMFRDGIDDLAQRNYASVYSRMNRLAQKAGLQEDFGVKGCKKIVSAGESFVEVDDNPVQVECIKEINRMTKTTGSSGLSIDEGEDKTLNVRILLTTGDGKQTPVDLSPGESRSTT